MRIYLPNGKERRLTLMPGSFKENFANISSKLRDIHAAS